MWGHGWAFAFGSSVGKQAVLITPLIQKEVISFQDQVVEPWFHITMQAPFGTINLYVSKCMRFYMKTACEVSSILKKKLLQLLCRF